MKMFSLPFLLSILSIKQAQMNKMVINPDVPQLFLYPQKDDTETLYITKFVQKRQSMGSPAYSYTWRTTPSLEIETGKKTESVGDGTTPGNHVSAEDVAAKQKNIFLENHATAKLVLTQFLEKIGFAENDNRTMMDYFFDVTDMGDDDDPSWARETSP
eukprot:TRINITY_DN3681_c1_g4_i1.p1 TRINITY_DN3681_c1_g4~~TRINITY_DN3681_c1_g4_i1.p1  ORF type:complete len:158 (-),score=31.10 TRINITY_DN3681_c1_g4_i1:136-609(-)